jgi:hypothetical protein
MGNRNTKTVLPNTDVPAYVEKIIKINQKYANFDKFHTYLYSSGDGFFHVEHNGY